MSPQLPRDETTMLSSEWQEETERLFPSIVIAAPSGMLHMFVRCCLDCHFSDNYFCLLCVLSDPSLSEASSEASSSPPLTSAHSVRWSDAIRALSQQLDSQSNGEPRLGRTVPM